jgi:Holliday junction resolvase RusA-like endonuclease
MAGIWQASEIVMIFTALIVPRGKERPRFYRKRSGRGIGSYTPKKTVSAEMQIRGAFYQFGGRLLMFGKAPIFCDIEARFPRAKRTKNGTRHCQKKPDWDNIGKLVCDSLNKVAYWDDSQICRGSVVKRYVEGNEPPSITISIDFL